MATSWRCTPRLAFALCGAISLLFFAVVVPAPSIAQIGSQTGYQEWVPPESGGGTTDGGGGAAGGSGGAATGEGGGGAAFGSGGGAAYGGDSGLAGAGGGGAAYGGDSGPAGGGRGATSATEPAGVESDEEGSGVADPARQPPSGRATAQRSEEATGTIPLTRDNVLLALAVAAAAIGVGFGVHRLARRTAGT